MFVLYRSFVEFLTTYSQPSGYGLGQNQFEEVLRTKIAEFGVHVELGMELTGFDQDQDGVTAHVRHHQGDIVSDVDIRASYLIGTDGAKGKNTTFLSITQKSQFLSRCDSETFEAYLPGRNSRRRRIDCWRCRSIRCWH